jgi:hypothetical protein
MKPVLFQQEPRPGTVQLPAARNLHRRHFDAVEVAADVGFSEVRAADNLAPESNVSELSLRAKVAVLAALVTASWIVVFYLASAFANLFSH